MLIPKTDAFAWPRFDVEPNKLIALCRSLKDAGLTYGMGCKIEPLSLQAPDLAEHGITAIDCSGLTRWEIYHACGGFEVPDGSANQHEFALVTGLKPSALEDGHNDDGIVRWGFLPPKSGEAGHTFFLVAGKLIESHGGGVGPDDSRVWGSAPWHPACALLVLGWAGE